MTGIIYVAVNKVNGKIYVGQTMRPLKERMQQHSVYSGKTHFANAIRKHGFNVFVFAIIDGASTRDELNQKESFWISHYACLSPKGYNLSTGGHHAVMCQSVRDKISAIRTGYKASEETKKKLSEARKGEKNSFYGKHHKDESKFWLGKPKEKHSCFGLKRPDTAARNRLLVGDKNPMHNKTGELNPFYGKGYMNAGDKNPMYGKKLSDEKKKLISQKTKEAMWRPEVREKFLKAVANRTRLATKRGAL